MQRNVRLYGLEAAVQAKEEDHFCDDDSSTDSGDFEARPTWA